ncbi:MAG: TonB family protein [Candidatus Eremiobacteraeota bacterium]|nr:TonB family protein [Candidatus Eremiobacteraeota bacterium]MBV8497936.1 TonB family protein [Candidatus Eremiobacteraeota bacterium]
MIVASLFNGLWQGALIVALTYASSKLIARRSAATRYALWLAGLIALVVVPVATSVSDAGAQLLRAFAAPPAHAGFTVALLPARAGVQHARDWLAGAATWILLGWLLGVAINVARLAVSFVRLERIRRRAQPLPLAGCDVYACDDLAVPIVAGLSDPLIVVPSDLAARLSPADFRRVVEHERAHVRRRDPLWNLVQRVIEATLFFNPWVRIAAAALSNEREAACDDWVVARTGSADEYAACLAALAQMLRTQKLPLLAASAYRSRHALVARIERLCAGGPRRLTVNAYTLGGTIVLFIVATLALQAFSPVLALTPAQTGIQNISSGTSYVAAACARPSVEAQVRSAAAPSPPHGFKVRGFVTVAVTIASNGRVVRTSVLHSSGDATVDAAVVTAARTSTYSPKIVNCTPVEGQYVFRADFEPSP